MNKSEEQINKTFWDTKFRLIQPNLRKTDAIDLDIESLLDEVVEYGANAILVNGGGIVAWYPTTNPYQHVNEYMDGDFLGEIIEGAHARDLKVLVRMDISKSFPHVLKEHPDWFRRDPDGQVIKHWEMLTVCPTGPYWEEYNFQVLEELLSKYPIDGFFYNAFNYLNCHCKRCHNRFKQETGFDIPITEDWDNPAWKIYVDYRYEQHAEYNQRLARFINEVSPGTVLTIDTHITTDSYKGIRDSGWYTPKFAEGNACITSEAFNFLDRPYPKWIYWAGEEVKIGNNIKQTSIILNYSKTIFSRRAAQPGPQLGYDLMQIAANGGSPAIAFSGTFNQDDRQSLAMVKKTFNYLAKNEEEYNGMTSQANVAIIYSQKTADYYGRDNPVDRWQTHYRGMYEILTESHIPFTVVHNGSINLEKLKSYSCVLLPNIAVLSKDEALILDKYVEEGGHLICTFETGFYDEKGERRSEQLLQCIGHTYIEEVMDSYTYLSVSDRDLLKDYPKSDLIMFTGNFLRTKSTEDEKNKVIFKDLYGIPAVQNTTPEFAYWDKVTEDSGLKIHSYGKGTASYLPWSPDKLYHLFGVPEYKSLIAGLVNRVCVSPIIECDAPGAVECLIAERKTGGHLIHLLNAVGTQGKPLTETVNISSIQLKIYGDFISANSLVTGDTYSIKAVNGYTIVNVPNLGLFDAIVVE